MTPTASAAIHLSRPPNVVHKPIFNVESNGAVGGSRYIECGAEIGRHINGIIFIEIIIISIIIVIKA